MTTKIVYEGSLHTNATHIKSGNVLETDAPTDNNGKGEAFSPTDLVAAAFGSCILTIMGIKARNKNIDIEGTTAEVTKVMVSDPRRIARLEAKIKMPKKSYSDDEKRLLEKVAFCTPVENSLHPDLEKVIEVEW